MLVIMKTSKTIINQWNLVWNEHSESTVEDVSTEHLGVKIYDNQGQEGAALNQLSGNSYLRLQLNEQYSCPQYGDLNFLDEKKLKPEMEIKH